MYQEHVGQTVLADNGAAKQREADFQHLGCHPPALFFTFLPDPAPHRLRLSKEICLGRRVEVSVSRCRSGDTAL